MPVYPHLIDLGFRIKSGNLSYCCGEFKLENRTIIKVSIRSDKKIFAFLKKIDLNDTKTIIDYPYINKSNTTHCLDSGTYSIIIKYYKRSGIFKCLPKFHANVKVKIMVCEGI